MNEYSCSVALGCNNMTICDILSPGRVSLRIRWSAHWSGAYREQRAESRDHRDNTNTAQPPQYGSCPNVRIICTKFQWYLAQKLGYSAWTSSEMWHNLIKSKLSINWKSPKLSRTGNKLTCKTLLRLPSLDWRLTGTVSGVRAVSPVCQENSKTKSILLFLGLTVLSSSGSHGRDGRAHLSVKKN